MAKFLGLEDVEKAAQRNPESFFIPSLRERKGQRVGDSVRLHFLLREPGAGEPRAERMWVTVTRACGLLSGYRGRLENQPLHLEDLAVGDEIDFRPCHIARVTVGRDDPMWIDSAEKKALVSAMCLDGDEVVRFLYREQPDGEEDSGWRMFTGHEPEGYADDPGNVLLADVGWMLDRDASLLEPLKQGVGAAYEREGRDDRWCRVTDWSPGE